MKYIYAYKSSDGVRHENTVIASSREEAFAILRTTGIRPIKVVAEDGSKANGELHGIRKRVVWLIVVVVAALVGGISFWSGSHSAPTVNATTIVSSPRHQIYGDPALIEKFEGGDFATVLPRLGDQLLAWHAQPGKITAPKGFDARQITPVMVGALTDLAKSSLATSDDLQIGPSEMREIQELKQIVNGIRQEMREYLADGNGTPKSFWRRLCERSLEEKRIYERTVKELESETNEAVWEEKNEALRRLGIRTISNFSETSL